MFPKPSSFLQPNTATFESSPLIAPSGFREYDARWWFGYPGSAEPPEPNLMGVQALGMGLGALLHRRGLPPGMVAESPVSKECRHAMFATVDAILRENPEVGAYN